MQLMTVCISNNNVLSSLGKAVASKLQHWAAVFNFMCIGPEL